MNLRKIEPDDFNTFQIEIEKIRTDIERTLNLTWFYVDARFKILEKDFRNKYSVDGSNDGGLDCYFQDGSTFYLIQSKYHSKSHRESLKSITHELQKIEKTIIGENTNKNASDFVNSLKRELGNRSAYLEIIWLSTNEVTENVKKDAQEFLNKILTKREWEISADINFIDRYALEGVVYDIKHGYVPHTGKKELTYEPGECMVINKDKNNIETIVCNAKAVDILSWFKNSSEISKYLQKNVRESVGENSINRAIQKSFKNDPSLFWYKHNGIIIFADWLEISQRSRKITIRNPQIVNGAQTITQLFKAYDENRSINNPAKILIRVYRLPYEDSETYERSIEIIAALNSQNKIKASDLHSTDPRQVMLESRINELGSRFSYYRKRTDQGRVASPVNIFMTKLALTYYVCEFRKPDEGISGAIELYFEDVKRYDDAFPEKLIKKPLNNSVDHIIFRYIDSWHLQFIINRTLQNELSMKHNELFAYVSWYILVDSYIQQQNWKEKSFNGSWRNWIEFLMSSQYTFGIVKYLKIRYSVYFSMLPKSEVDPRNFYKTVDGRKKFLKNPGNSKKFKAEISRAHELFKRSSGY